MDKPQKLYKKDTRKSKREHYQGAIMAQEPKYTTTIMCFANSRKLSGRCIAGKKFAAGQATDWIRPVSSRQHEEISESDRRYKDGSTASVLDIISIPMLRPKPGTYQAENHLIADQSYWKKTGRATWKQVEQAVDTVNGPLWINGYESGGGSNDRVPEGQAAKLTSSLLLVKPSKVQIRVAPKGDPNAPAKRSVRAIFTLNGIGYNLGLSDALMERVYLQQQNGTYPVADAILCVSLGEPFNGHVYKIAAALITPDRV